MRSNWKGPFIDKTLLRRQFNLIDNNTFEIRSRRSVILPFLINKTVKIYNGHKYFLLKIMDYHVGHKFGDFVLTKKRCIFKKGKKK